MRNVAGGSISVEKPQSVMERLWKAPPGQRRDILLYHDLVFFCSFSPILIDQLTSCNATFKITFSIIFSFDILIRAPLVLIVLYVSIILLHIVIHFMYSFSVGVSPFVEWICRKEQRWFRQHCQAEEKKYFHQMNMCPGLCPSSWEHSICP